VHIVRAVAEPSISIERARGVRSSPRDPGPADPRVRARLRVRRALPACAGCMAGCALRFTSHLNKLSICKNKPGGLDMNASSIMAAKRASALAAHTYYLAAPLAAPPHELPDLLPDLLAIWVAALPLVLQLCPALLVPLRP